jgi:hypothetical protein
MRPNPTCETAAPIPKVAYSQAFQNPSNLATVTKVLDWPQKMQGWPTHFCGNKAIEG